jgi:hypothetical protein
MENELLFIKDRLQIKETVNQLFIYTDFQEWSNLKEKVFYNEVYLDMTSMGAKEPKLYTSKEICEMWKDGFKDVDAIHHQAGNFVIEVDEDEAAVFVYATATHYREKPEKKIESFVGGYDFNLIRTINGWRITRMRYNLKYTL